MRIIFILLLSASFLKAMTIDEAIKEAIKNNPNIVQLKAEEDASLARVKQAKSSFFPSLSFGFTYSRVSSVPTFPGGIHFGFPDSYTGNFQLQYPVFTWGKRGNSIKLSQVGVENSRVTIQLKESEIRYNVVRSFYGLILAERGLNLAKDAFERAQEHLRSVLDQYKAGRATDLDTLKARVALSNAKVQVLKATHQIETAREGLNLILGRSPQGEIKPEGKLEFNPVNITLEKCIQAALTRRKELKSINLAHKSIAISKQITKATLRPSLGIMVNYQYEKPFQFFENRWGRLLSAGVSANFPLFDGFSTRAKLMELDANERSLTAQEKALRDIIVYDVSQSFNELQEAQEILEVQKKTLVQARKALNVAKDQYKAGFLSELQYEDAEFALTQAEFQWISTVYKAIVAKSALIRATGVKNIEDLEVR